VHQCSLEVGSAVSERFLNQTEPSRKADLSFKFIENTY